MNHDVTVFRPYAFYVGQKIRIEGSRRGGDWEIAAVGEHTVTLKCPVSKREFEWAAFCYMVEEEHDVVWPQKH